MNKISNAFKKNLMKVIILSDFALLIFVLNIPGTIALRNVLAGLLLIILTFSWLKNEDSIKPLFKNKNFISTISILLILTTYIFFHSIFIADEMSWSLSQYRTQWIYPMLYFTMGILLAFFASSGKYFNEKNLVTILFYSLSLHVLYVDLITIYQYIESGHFVLRYGGLTRSAVLANYITNILISIIIVEFIFRFRVKKRIVQLNSLWLMLVLLLCIFSAIIEHLRFGVISLFFMSLTGLIFFIFDNSRFNSKAKSFVAITLLLLCSLPLLYNAKNDVRWLSLIETIPIAMDTETHLYWQGNSSGDSPTLASGEKVSYSNYMRIAWITKGIDYISNDIFGIGYGRNVFGHAMEKYDGKIISRGYHSHSSIIDFTIGVGVLGIGVWFLFVIKIILSESKIFINHGNYFSLLSVFIISGFFIRSFVDSNMRDHMFKQFFLILGIAITLSFYEQIKNKKIS